MSTPIKSWATLRVRPETRAKLDAISADRRWKLAEAVDAVTDHYVSTGGKKQTPRRTKPAG